MIVLYFSLKDDYEEIMKAIFNMSIGWGLFAVFLFCAYRSLVGYSIYNLAKINDEKL